MKVKEKCEWYGYFVFILLILMISLGYLGNYLVWGGLGVGGYLGI